VTQQALTSNRFSRSSLPISSISNRFETERTRDSESGAWRALSGCGVVRFWQAVRRTAGKATTFRTRLENLPWEYWLRTSALSWGFERGLVDFPVWVSESGEGLGNRVENSLREELIEGQNSSGFILLACISIEATTTKAMEVWILQYIEICLRVEALC
jgi:hypothetical protein